MLSNRDYVNYGYRETFIFDDTVSTEELSLISPTLEIESGTAGSLEFTYPTTNQGYSLTEPMKTEVVVMKKGEEVWRGRVLNPDVDFYNQMKVTVEGELSYLNDTIQPQHEYKTETLAEVIAAILKIHNDKIAYIPPAFVDVYIPNRNEPFSKIFYPGACFVSKAGDPTGTDVSYRKTNFNTTLDALKQIAKAYNGYFIVRRRNGKRYLDFEKNFNTICQQRIDFGANLLDYSKTFKMEDLCTVAMPIGGSIKDEAGDEVYIYHSENDNDVNFLDENGYLGWDPDARDREAGVVYMNELGLTKGDKLYITSNQCKDPNKDTPGYQGRLKDGLWAFATENGTPIARSIQSYSSDSGIETYEKHAVTVPAGAHRLRVGSSTTNNPKLRVYKQRKESGLEEYFTISSYNDVDDENFKHDHGDIYIVYKPLYEKYGRHERKLEFSNLEKAEDLWNMATYWLTNTQFEQMTLTVKAIDLSMMDASYDDIWINMNVPIYSAPHGLTDTSFSLPCTKMTIKFGEPENTEYTLGYSTHSEISNTESSVNANIEDLMNQIPTMSSTLKVIQENSTQIINTMASVGAVTFLHDDSNHPEQITGIVIANDPDPNLATEQWIWNAGGFGYRQRTSGQSWDNIKFETAITMDGTILGKFIAAQSMYADAIWGGTLKLGHVPYEDPITHAITYRDGLLQMFADNGRRVLELSKDFGVTQDGPTAYCRMNNGKITGKGNNASTDPNNGNAFVLDGEVVSGVINFNMMFDGNCGMHITSRRFGINTDYIYLCDHFNGSTIKVGLTQTVTVGDKNLEFIHGMLVGVTENSNGGE